MASNSARRFPGRDVGADVGAAAELRALGAHLRQPPVQVPLFHLELGDAVAQQAARGVGALEHGHVVTLTGQLLRGGQAGRPGTDHGHLLARLHRRGERLHPALGPRAVDDLHLDLLDGHRIGVDAQHAGGLTGGRAEPAGEFREVVGRVQPFGGLVPVVPPHQVVPLRNEVAERAAGVAEGDAAIHAAAGLPFEAPRGKIGVHLAPVPDPHVHRAAGRCLTRRGQESLGIGHRAVVLLCGSIFGASVSGSVRGRGRAGEYLGDPAPLPGPATWAAARTAAATQASELLSRARRP